YDINIKKFECKTLDSTATSEFKCVLHKNYAYQPVSVFFKLKETFARFDIFYSMDVFKKDGTKMNIAHVKLDGCKFLGSFYSNFLYGKFFKRIQSVSNLPKKCPIMENQLFEIRNYTTIPDEFPLGLPALQYQLRLKLSSGDREIAEVVAEGAVVY
ncbi:hypothetical protein KR222_011674, partial [Zaprionus bogoriensis]